MRTNGEWHKMNAVEAMQEIGADEGGLDTRSASDRIKRDGRNTVWDHGTPFTFLFRENYFSLLGIAVLIIAAVAAEVFAKTGAAASVIVAAAIGLVLRAGICIAAGLVCCRYSERWIPRYTVRRNGEDERVRGDMLAVGDIVRLTAGETVPADGKLLAGCEIVVNELFATGAKKQRVKRAYTDAPVRAGESIPVADDVLLAGSAVTGGKCRMVVLAVGDDCAVVRRRGRIRISSPAESARMTRVRRESNIVGTAALALAFVCVIAGIFDPLAAANLAGLFLVFFAFAVSSYGEVLPAAECLGYACGMIRADKNGAAVRDYGIFDAVPDVDAVAVVGIQNLRSGTSHLNAVYAGGKADARSAAGDELFSLLMCTSDDSKRIGKMLVSAVGDYVGNGESAADFAASAHRKYAILDKATVLPKEHALLFDGRDLLFTSVGPIENVIPACTHMRQGGDDVPITSESLRGVLAAAADAARSAQSIIAVAVRTSPYNSIKRLSVLDQGLTLVGFAAIDSPASESLSPLMASLREMNVPLAVFCDGTGEDANFLRRNEIISDRSDITPEMNRDFADGRFATSAVAVPDSRAAQKMILAASDGRRILVADSSEAIRNAANGKPGSVAASAKGNASSVKALLALAGEAAGLHRRSRTALMYLRISLGVRCAYAVSILFGAPIVSATAIVLWGLVLDLAAASAIFVLPGKKDGKMQKSEKKTNET